MLVAGSCKIGWEEGRGWESDFVVCSSLERANEGAFNWPLVRSAEKGGLGQTLWKSSALQVLQWSMTSFISRFSFMTGIYIDIYSRSLFSLQVWGLFAPKYVFDVVGLILTDVFICLASLYYFWRVGWYTVEYIWVFWRIRNGDRERPFFWKHSMEFWWCKNLIIFLWYEVLSCLTA